MSCAKVKMYKIKDVSVARSSYNFVRITPKRRLQSFGFARLGKTPGTSRRRRTDKRHAPTDERLGVRKLVTHRVTHREVYKTPHKIPSETE